jgi:hypothetical protein
MIEVMKTIIRHFFASSNGFRDGWASARMPYRRENRQHPGPTWEMAGLELLFQ